MGGVSMAVKSWLTGILMISALYVLVGPQSQGPKFITDLFTGMEGLLKTAMGGGAAATGSSSGGSGN